MEKEAKKKKLKQCSIATMFSQPKPMIPSETEPTTSEPILSAPSASQPVKEGPPEKKIKSSISSQSRDIKSSWFSIFPWLLHDRQKEELFCQICKDANMGNIFTSGKKTSLPKKDDMIKHEKTKDHIQAKALPKRQHNFKLSVQKAQDTAKDSIICQMRTVLTQAKNHLPSSKNSALLQLQVLNGCSALSKLNPFNVKGTSHYSHHESIDDFYQCLTTITTEDMLAEVRNSPFKIFTLEADEATDTSNDSVVVVYIRYIALGGVVRTRFLGVRELQQTTADAITTAIQDVIDARNLNTMVLAGLTTDGASVMVGTKKGVATQFKKKYPQLLTSHCMAHRLQLVAEKSANQCTYLVKYISVLNTFAKSLKYSPKLCRILEACKSVTGEKSRKIKQVFFTRWLSFTDSVQALSGCLSSVISATYEAAGERNAQGGAVLHGCAKQMATFKFVYLTAFLSDAVGILGILNKTMQKENIQHSTLMMHVKSSISALEDLLHNHGPYVTKLMEELPDHNPELLSFSYKGHDIKNNAKERKTAHDTCLKFIDEVVTRLTSTFPEDGIMDALGIFDPSNYDADQEILTYGIEKLKQLLQHFEIADEISSVIEWKIIRGLLKEASSRHPKPTICSFYQQFIYPDLEAFPNIGRLATIAVAVPATSVNCERAISTYNAIKTPLRSSLNTTSVEDLMFLSTEAPSVEMFPYERAFAIWSTQKDRIAYRNMMKIDQKNQQAASACSLVVKQIEVNPGVIDEKLPQNFQSQDMQEEVLDLSKK